MSGSSMSGSSPGRRNATPKLTSGIAGHVGDPAAGVHPWPHPATSGGAASAPGRPRRVHCTAGRHQRTGLHRHRLGAAASVRARQAGRLVRPHQDRRQEHPAAWPVPARGHHRHPVAAPVVAGVRLRAGRAGSGKGAASMLTEAINTGMAAGADPANIQDSGGPPRPGIGAGRQQLSTAPVDTPYQDFGRGRLNRSGVV